MESHGAGHISATEQGARAVGRAVATRRGELRLTQAELAAASGLSTRTISVVESGRWSGTRRSICAALDVGLQWQVGTTAALVAAGSEQADPYPTAPPAPAVDQQLLGLLASATPEAVDAVRAVLRASQR
jgi:transcriptional regulator with XRE-family HTH domain